MMDSAPKSNNSIPETYLNLHNPNFGHNYTKKASKTGAPTSKISDLEPVGQRNKNLNFPSNSFVYSNKSAPNTIDLVPNAKFQSTLYDNKAIGNNMNVDYNSTRRNQMDLAQYMKAVNRELDSNDSDFLSSLYMQNNPENNTKK